MVVHAGMACDAASIIRYSIEDEHAINTREIFARTKNSSPLSFYGFDNAACTIEMLWCIFYVFGLHLEGLVVANDGGGKKIWHQVIKTRAPTSRVRVGDVAD